MFHTRMHLPLQHMVSLWLASTAKRPNALGPQIVGTHLNANYEIGWALMRYQPHRLGFGITSAS